jgi:hypothetical protein
MRKTCKGCEHLMNSADNQSKRIAPVFFCGITKEKRQFCIPHGCDTNEDEFSAVFFRVPLFCPLPDNEVQKRADPLPVQQWEKEKFKHSY